MIVEELTQWLPLLAMGTSLSVAAVPGIKYVNRRWGNSLDNRINSCITKGLEPLIKKIDENTQKLGKVETRLDGYEKFFFRGSSQ